MVDKSVVERVVNRVDWRVGKRVDLMDETVYSMVVN
jgi:hypothetical protein